MRPARLVPYDPRALRRSTSGDINMNQPDSGITGIRLTVWRRGWDSNPCAIARKLISSQVVKTEPGGIWRKITADARTPKMPCFQGFPHLFASKTKWKSESESLLRFRRVLTDFRKSLLEFLIEPSDFSPQNHAFGSAWKAPVMPDCTKSRVG